MQPFELPVQLLRPPPVHRIAQERGWMMLCVISRKMGEMKAARGVGAASASVTSVVRARRRRSQELTIV